MALTLEDMDRLGSVAWQFFRDHPYIVDGAERWERALAGKKRDARDMRVILEHQAVIALTMLVMLERDSTATYTSLL